jgi:LAO/AO transport system kinase
MAKGRKRGSREVPEWVPEDAGDAFATSVRRGIGPEDRSRPRSRTGETAGGAGKALLPVEEYVKGVLAGDRPLLARTITLIESNAVEHFRHAQEVLQSLLPHAEQAYRIGITGIPGSGKSTLIESLGLLLIASGLKVAVLTVDPSSSITGGSILGDKTRMERLSREKNCYIRPSPSGGTLGGVTRKSRETILVCEAAGFDVILIETVGVGQNEITVRSMVDFFLLVTIAGAGDELQGIKRGVVEIADAVVVNKAEGENRSKALRAQSESSMALRYLTPATPGWDTRVFLCSAQTGEGIPELWQVMKSFKEITHRSGYWSERRRKQNLEWVFNMVERYLNDNFYTHGVVQRELPEIRDKVLRGDLLPTQAARLLLRSYFASDEKID